MMGNIFACCFPKTYLRKKMQRRPSLRTILKDDYNFQKYLKIYSGKEEENETGRLEINL